LAENYTPDESVAVDSFTKLRDNIDSQVYALLKLNDANDDRLRRNASVLHNLSQSLFRSCLERKRECERFPLMLKAQQRSVAVNKQIKFSFLRNLATAEADIQALKDIISKLGGWPLLAGNSWDGDSTDSKWTFFETIRRIRKMLGHREDKAFDVASFVINLDSNNVSCSLSLSFSLTHSLHHPSSCAVHLT